MTNREIAEQCLRDEAQAILSLIPQLDEQFDKAVDLIYQCKGKVILTGVGVYSYNTSDDEAARMRNAIQRAVMSHVWALQMHGFYADVRRKTVRFDVVLSFDISRKEAMDVLYAEIRALYPDFELLIVPDVDVTD